METPHPSSKQRAPLSMRILVLTGTFVLIAGVASFLFVAGENRGGILNLPPVMWIIAAVVILLSLIVTIIVLFRSDSLPSTPDYRALFNLGVIFFVIGLGTDNPGFWGMGFALAAIGISKKKEWKRPKPLSELPPAKRRFKLGIIIGLGVLVLLGIAVLLLTGS